VERKELRRVLNSAVNCMDGQYDFPLCGRKVITIELEKPLLSGRSGSCIRNVSQDEREVLAFVIAQYPICSGPYSDRIANDVSVSTPDLSDKLRVDCHNDLAHLPGPRHHWFNHDRVRGRCNDAPPAEFTAAFYADQRAPQPGRNPMS